jgi:hypothetical protein
MAASSTPFSFNHSFRRILHYGLRLAGFIKPGTILSQNIHLMKQKTSRKKMRPVVS